VPDSFKRPIDIVRCKALLARFVSHMQMDGAGTCAHCAARFACQFFRGDR
jgi:hypothetical protein